MSNKLLAIIVLTFIGSGLCQAEDFGGVLSQIESNNTTLKALRARADAGKMESRIALNLSDPTIEAGYLWETRDENGSDRIDLGVSQSFDFPSVYYWRKKFVDGECSAIELEYAIQRKEILKEAELCLIDLLWLKSQQSVLGRCHENAEGIVAAVQQKFDNGSVGNLELSSARLEMLSTAKAVRSNAIDLKETLVKLERLNGGVPVDLPDQQYELPLAPGNFDSWFSQASGTSSEMNAASLSEEIAGTSIKLAGAEALPKFSIGYSSEIIAGSHLQGISVGISIPLWENRGKVKAAKAREAASRAESLDIRDNMRSTMKQEHSRALELWDLIESYRSELNGINSIDMLDNTLAGGQIGFEEYVHGMERWVNAYLEVLEMERDYRKAVCQINWFAR